MLELGPTPTPNRKAHPFVGSLEFQGIPVHVENAAGSHREGTDPDGKPWKVYMHWHYGEVPGTDAVDGDPLDVYVGPDAEAPFAYVVHQKIPGSQVYDEDKVMLGFRTAALARAAYLKQYTRPGFYGGMTRWPVDELRAKLGTARGGRIRRRRTRDVPRLDTPKRIRLMIKSQLSLFGGQAGGSQLGLFESSARVKQHRRRGKAGVTVVQEHQRRQRRRQDAPTAGGVNLEAAEQRMGQRQLKKKLRAALTVAVRDFRKEIGAHGAGAGIVGVKVARMRERLRGLESTLDKRAAAGASLDVLLSTLAVDLVELRDSGDPAVETAADTLIRELRPVLGYHDPGDKIRPDAAEYHHPPQAPIPASERAAFVATAEKLLNRAAAEDAHIAGTRTIQAADRMLQEFDRMLEKHTSEPTAAEYVKLTEALDAVEKYAESSVGELSGAQVGGLTVYSEADSIRLYASEIVREAVAYKRLGIDGGLMGAKTWEAGRAILLRPDVRGMGILERGTARARVPLLQGFALYDEMEGGFIHANQERQQQHERTVDGLAANLADVAALPKSHHQLLEAGGVAVRLMISAISGKSAKERWRGICEVRPWLGHPGPQITLFNQGIAFRQNVGEGQVTLTHEVGHAIDRLIESVTMPGEFSQLAAWLADHATRGSQGTGILQGGAWATSPDEWLAEAYRYAYRNGGELVTTLKSHGYDPVIFRQAVDEQVAAALAKLGALEKAVILLKKAQIGLFGEQVSVKSHKRAGKKGRIRVRAHTARRQKLHEVYSDKAAPKPGERGYRAPDQAPGGMDGRDPAEVAATALALAPAGKAYQDEGDDYDDFDPYGELIGREYDPGALADLLRIPHTDYGGLPLSPEDRDLWASTVITVHDQTQPPDRSRGIVVRRLFGRTDSAARSSGFDVLPAWAAAAIAQDWMTSFSASLDLPGVKKTKTRLVPVSVDDAAAFIEAHHSQLPETNRRGLMYALGIEKGGRLVAVATAGTPTGRWSDPHSVLEVTRIASDGSTRNAASMLMSRLIDLAEQSKRPGATGPAVVVTYSLVNEPGTPYKALKQKGLRPTKRVAARDPAGQRYLSGSSLNNVDKIRWEAGPGAADADWELLADDHGPLFRSGAG